MSCATPRRSGHSVRPAPASLGLSYPGRCSAKTVLGLLHGELNFPCVNSLNFRSQWQGSPGKPRKFGNCCARCAPGVHLRSGRIPAIAPRGFLASNRIFAELAAFMAHPSTRQDRLFRSRAAPISPHDLKRQGTPRTLALFIRRPIEARAPSIILKKWVYDPVQSIKEVIDDPRTVCAAIEHPGPRCCVRRAAGDQPVSAETARGVRDSSPPVRSRELQILVACIGTPRGLPETYSRWIGDVVPVTAARCSILTTPAYATIRSNPD